mgnify:CR=1 FL=1
MANLKTIDIKGKQYVEVNERIKAKAREMKDQIREAMGKEKGAHILGIHLEGIFINPEKKGIIYDMKFIDKWEDIQNYSRVAFINRGIEANILKEIGRLEFDGISLCVPKDIDAYFSEVYGEDFKERKIIPKGQNMRVILDTEVSYKEIMEEVGDLIKKAKATREEVMWGRLKAYNEKIAIDNVWKLVQMTDRQIFLQDMFKEKTDELLKYDLNNEDNNYVYNKLINVTNFVSSTLQIFLPTVKVDNTEFIISSSSSSSLTISIEPRTFPFT